MLASPWMRVPLRQASEGDCPAAGSARTGLLPECLQPDERRPGLHLRVHLREHRADHAILGRGDGRFHLHALDHSQRVTGSHDVTLRDQDGHDEPWGRASDLPSFVAGDDVQDAVDLDEQPGTLAGGDNLVPPATAGDGPLVTAESLHGDVDHGGPVPAALSGGSTDTR